MQRESARRALRAAGSVVAGAGLVVACSHAGQPVTADATVETQADAANDGSAVDAAVDALLTEIADGAADQTAAEVGPDVAANDANVDDAGCRTSCWVGTGARCEEATDCGDGHFQQCLGGECFEADVVNAAAMACCQEAYQALDTCSIPAGCNPWGPRAPPAFDLAALDRLNARLAA